MNSLFRTIYKACGTYTICACHASTTHFIPKNKSVYDHEVVRRRPKSKKTQVYQDIEHFYMPSRLWNAHLVMYDANLNNEIKHNQRNKVFLEALPSEADKYVCASTGLDKGHIPKEEHISNVLENTILIENRYIYYYNTAV